ncbi:response regulator [uncultured Methanoregula sp.]|uniref:response regulator n=1 Tax=uncultured Methanoregula sp. TaxID=1005933 RepID=UPI002AABC38F|nr:response regulator [uncultured Methanoregula sp.]
MTAPPRIFIVEDEAIVASDIKETLLSLGYAVDGTAKTGETAVEKVAEKRPDLVLMDINLAGSMDGIEAADRIHTAHGIPVIFLTAFADKPLLDRAKKAEPYGYIIKPYDERVLQSAIEMAVYKHRMERRLQETEETTRVMVNATQDLLYLVGTEGRFLMANEALAGIVGTTPEELQGTSAYDLVGKNILTPKMACWQLNTRGEKRLVFEEQLNRSWYDVTIYPVYDTNGTAEKYAVSVRNITIRKQSEEQVRNNADYFRAIIEEASEVVVLLNPNGTFSQQSPSFKTALGYLPDQDLKKSFFDYISMSDWQQAKQVFSEVLVHPGMAKPVRLKFEKIDRNICSIRGIMSNLSDNPFVGKIVLNGWVE